MTLERREASIGAGSGRELRGLALPYDVEVSVAGMRERFEPGSASSTGEAVLNVHHREDRPLAREPGTLTFESRADGLYLSATLPETREADDALALVRAEVLTGLSVEFRAERERMVAGVRRISKATVAGVGLVARPAYKTTQVEARGAALASALIAAASGPEIDAAAISAGITVEQLRRALAAFGSAFPEPAIPAAARPEFSVPWWAS